MRIYLIGLPACGKSTVGKELAKKIKYDFIDLDQKIVKDNNQTIDEMFEISESYFRDKESKALEDVLNLDNIVVSCGGGIVERDINKTFMKGVVVYLECPLSEVEFRLNRDTTSRPVSKKVSIYELYERRSPKYDSFKDFKVDSRIVSKTVKEIRKDLKKYAKNSCD